jgi:hypothetical protein
MFLVGKSANRRNGRKWSTRALFVVTLALSGVMVSGTVIAKHVLAAPPYPYDFIPSIQSDPTVPPPIPNDGTGDASNSAIYPGQSLMFKVMAKNAGTTATAPQEETMKMFMLDPNPGDPYYRAEASCGGNCYATPGKASYPQPGINWPWQGFLYGYNPMPVINPGQTFTLPPQTPASAPNYSLISTIPADAPVGRKFCFYAHTHPGNPDNLNPDGTNNGGYPDTGFGKHCYVVQALGNGVCDGIALEPAILDPGNWFRVTGRVRYNSSSAANYMLNTPGTRFYINITGPGVNRSYANVTPLTVNGSVLTATTGWQAPTGQTGTYTVTYGVASSAGSANCSATFGVAKQPYFQVNGGDISAGAGMSIGGKDCAAAGGLPAVQNASIVSWNRDSWNGYGGAGTQYAALALNHLQGFATGQGSPYAPSGLAFANTGGGAGHIDAGRQLYGGKFGGTNCTGDYWKNANNVLTGNVTVGGQAIANGTHKTIYVDGKVTITGNITFSGNYASAADIPTFTVIVRGALYVDKSVTQMDGFYIAEPVDTADESGAFKTCAKFWFTPADLDRTLQSNCDLPLTINGAIVGRQLRLNRTAGTLSTTPAETFNYSPEFWLTAPYGNGLNPANDSGYDSITSLPPVL